MTFGVFMHKDGSIYDDIPEVHYQFPKRYLSRAQQMVGDWIVYREPVKPAGSKGFFAVAKVERIIPDPDEPERYRALIEEGSYLPFEPTVPHIVNGQQVERGVLNEAGNVSGRAQAAIRPLWPSDFARIIALGLPDEDYLPRVDEPGAGENTLREERMPFAIERPLVQTLVSKPFRERAFRRAVMHAYDGRCAVTGWKLINGGGRLEAQAAHIRPVEHGGPDSVRNGLALSGTAHWMFDRGLICLSDDHDIMIHRKVNDRDGVAAIINPSGKLILPKREADRPHPKFLGWHREFHSYAA
ncbi:HNH endonuclease [Alteriqipengyuania sp.]|uniref:HNH endonuclease n=1 Tax=Alteriqipengyuania sp. TaxID=2800692 RepID=UPI003512BA04